jgi:predicted nucleic acid-binding protein
MRVLVSDTSVLVDLERADLLTTAFALPLELVVPDILYARELHDFGGTALTQLGLLIEELDAAGVQLAQDYRRQKPGLSVPDAFALALARSRGWALLVGDALLRAHAESENVECHGVLWLLDLMHENAIADPKTLYDGLHRLSTNPRCRLPKREVRARLEIFLALTGA